MGPARRLQTALREVGEGNQVAPLIYRDNGFWQEMAADFNRVNDRITQLSARPARPIDAVPGQWVATSEEAALAGRVE